MRQLQDLFDKQFEDQLEFSSFAADLVESELEKQGIYLTAKQKTQLINELKKNKDSLDESSTIQINDDGTVQVVNKNGSSDFEIDLLEGAESKMNDLPSLINESSEAKCEIYLSNIKKRTPSILRGSDKNQKRFNKQLNKKWGKLLDLLEVFILVSEEIGAEFTDSILNSTNGETSPRFIMLSHSHARSCQISKEVMTLLQNGFADGAHARWRTLHEIAVETNIINRNNDKLARKYLEHDIVQKLQSARVFQEHYKELDYEPITNEELNELETAYNKLVSLYGKNFAKENGWAIELLEKERASFVNLEALADFAHMRPFYKMACLNVHGGPRGLMFRLGLNYEGDEKFLLSGSSINGLAEPVQNTAYSLLQITSALLTYEINLDYIVALKVLFKLEQEIFEVTDQIIHQDNNG